MYRKINERSRSWSIKQIDTFLFFAVIVLLAVFAAVNLLNGKNAALLYSELFINQESENLFGKDIISALIWEFGERNPKLKIRLEGAKSGDSGNKAADIVFFDESQFRGLVQEGALLSLNPYMHTETGGEQRAIPLVSFMDLLFYNIDLLQKAGFDRPPKTRAEFAAYAKAVSAQNNDGKTADEGIYGSALGLSSTDPLAVSRDIFSWIWAEGASLSREEKPYFGNRTALEAITFLGQLNKEGALAPGTFTKTGADRADEFAEGKIALLIASSREIIPLRKRMGYSIFSLSSIPLSSAAGKSALKLSRIYAGISSSCANPDEAWTFLTFLAEQSSPLAAKLGAVPGFFPGDSAFSGGNAADRGYIRTDPLYSKAWDIFEASETIRWFSEDPIGDELEAIVQEELRSFFEQESRPVDTQAAIQKRWDRVGNEESK